MPCMCVVLSASWSGRLRPAISSSSPSLARSLVFFSSFFVVVVSERLSPRAAAVDVNINTSTSERARYQSSRHSGGPCAVAINEHYIICMSNASWITLADLRIGCCGYTYEKSHTTHRRAVVRDEESCERGNPGTGAHCASNTALRSEISTRQRPDGNRE